MACITKDESEIFYEVSYSNDNSMLLLSEGERFLFTDGRYFEEAKVASKGCEVICVDSLVRGVAATARALKIKKISFDPTVFSHDEFRNLRKLTPSYLEPKKGILAKKRVVKTDAELQKIKTAAKLGRDGFKKFAKKINSLKKAPSEYELGYIAKKTLTSKGVYDVSFEPITAVDENAANPHAGATDKKLLDGSLILFDGGIKFERYCSDRTRTAFFSDGFVFKKTQRFKDKKLQHIYDTVLKAQESAIEAAKPGMKAKELDKIARDVIDKAGYGKYFVHSLGHGVGLDIHEYPYIRKNSDEVLPENSVFTVEPGIYIPGYYGVRIEDMVVLKSDGAEVL